MKQASSIAIALITLTTFGLFGQVALAVSADNCRVTRSAIDIGSGTTRLIVAEVDRCRARIIRHLHHVKRDVRYKKDIGNNNGSLSAEIQQEGIQALRGLLELTKAQKPVAIATEALRQARNSTAYLQRIEKELGIKIQIIDQQQEASLGFKAALSEAAASSKDYVVWDIGGGSMQISAMVDGKLHQFNSKLGAVPAKEIALQVKKNKAATPNPISKAEARKIVQKYKNKAARLVPAWLKKIAANRRFIGIGGVHYYNTCSHLEGKQKGCTFYRDELMEAVEKKLLGRDDQALGNDKYVDVKVTNPLLITAIMQQLGIYQVQTANINIASGVVIDNSFY